MVSEVAEISFAISATTEAQIIQSSVFVVPLETQINADRGLRFI